MPPKASRQVEVYDFRRPTTLAREHARVLEMAFETFGRQWGTQLTAKVRVLSQVTSEQVQTMTYDEYVAGLPEHTGMVLFSMPNISAKAVIQFPMAAALSWVRHMLGGTGNEPTPERKLTHIEQALLSRIMDEALEDLHYALGSLLAAPLSPSSIQYNSQFAQAAGSTVPMIVARFEMVVGDASAPATVALPAEAILPQLGPVRPDTSNATPAELVAEHLANLPLEVCLQLAPIHVKPGMVLNLSVGDVLKLDHPQHRPLNVAVDGQTLAQAAVGASGSRLAGVIVSTEENI